MFRVFTHDDDGNLLMVYYWSSSRPIWRSGRWRTAWKNRITRTYSTARKSIPMIGCFALLKRTRIAPGWNFTGTMGCRCCPMSK